MNARPVIQAGSERLNAGTYDLVVETTDGDDLQNVYTERRFLPTLEPRETAILQAFVRPGSSNSDITVSVRSLAEGGKILSQTTLKPTRGDYAPMEPHNFVYLTLGGPLSGLGVRPGLGFGAPGMGVGGGGGGLGGPASGLGVRPGLGFGGLGRGR